jgi:hypothetical protein
MARPTTKARLAGAGGRSNRRRPAPRVIPPRAAVSKPKVVAPQPKPNNVVSGPTFKGSPTIVRPDGVTEVLGPGGVVLEEIGVDGKLINDPIKDSGIDPKNPPPSIQALRDEFREHVESGRDESGEPFFVSNETKAALEADGLGDKGGAFTKDELIKRKVIKPNGELSDKYGQTANEKVVNPNEEQANLSPRDYVATIEEVIDSNRVRVSLSYNDGVNLYGHKGEDQVSKRFKGFKVNYVKNNIERYKTYAKVDSQYYLVTNSVLGVDGEQRILKTKLPLSEDIEFGEGFTFVEKRLPDYIDNVRLVPFEDDIDDGIFLRLPNFNSADNPINFQGTQYQTHTNLLSDSAEDSRDIERLLISGSLLDVQPNIDYQKTTTDLNLEADDTGFGNFIHFSNVESRLRNFRDKLELIEGYNDESSSLVSISSSLETIQEIEAKRQRVKNSFDPFEHYMYFESSSYVSSSDGQFHDTSWPKTNSSSPYTLEAVGSTNANTWFNNMIASASDYDQRNMNSLRNSLPEHIYADTSNNVFLEFMDMVGQYFDEVWTYTKSITDLNVRVNKISEGISKDVAIHYAKALGLELYSGNDLLTLPNYLLGKNADGTDLYESPQEEVTEKIWKRILANLPFFIKTKGTERSLKGLLNCYGIPSTMLRVREYGGPDKGTRVSYEIKRKFTRATDFKAAQYIQSNWKTASDGLIPDTVEFRFRTPHSVGTSGSMVLLQKDDDWAIHLQDNGTTDNYGHLRFTISGSDGSVNFITSSLQPFYNDEMWSVMLTRKSASNGLEFDDDSIYASSSFELTTKYYESTRQKILYQDSQSMEVTASVVNAAFTSSGHVYLGGSGSSFGNQLSGSLMEYRLWSEPLSQSIFDNHVRTPKAYNGNHYSSSFDELLVRYQLDENKNLSSSATASNTAHDASLYSEVQSVDVDGFTGNFSRTLVDQEKVRVPSLGPTRRNATKIRIEDTFLPPDKNGSGSLLVDKRREKSNDDFAPLDDHSLGVYFSPVDVVNEDIMYSIADFNFDDFIGDPRDESKPIYKDLRHLRREYFKRYDMTNNFFDYLRILQFYDSSLYDTLYQLVPARAKTSVGVLIEPNILERSKQTIGRETEFDNQYYENAGEYDDGVLVTRYITGSNDNYFETSGEYTTYNGEINAAFFDTGSSLGFLNNRSRMILNDIDKRGEYGTTYATASITSGSHNNIFTEVLQPNVSGSRLSEKSQVREYFYSSSLSASIGPSVAYSSSFKASEFESMAVSTNLFRAFYKGIILTRDNSIDGEEPIIVNEVAPTVLKTQDSDTSKLRTE